ncbi:hypothetical protein [Nostoc sp.]|uniref:hypothetical protein n=1 Tax=Nostoc sp. TaxID=1180 RepID=UPI002FF896CE
MFENQNCAIDAIMNIASNGAIATSKPALAKGSESTFKLFGTSSTIRIRELQEINYPILWGGRLARPIDWAGETPTPQELIGYFFICKSLMPLSNRLVTGLLNVMEFVENTVIAKMGIGNWGLGIRD